MISAVHVSSSRKWRKCSILPNLVFYHSTNFKVRWRQIWENLNNISKERSKRGNHFREMASLFLSKKKNCHYWYIQCLFLVSMKHIVKGISLTSHMLWFFASPGQKRKVVNKELYFTILGSLKNMQLIVFNKQLSNFWNKVIKVKNTCKSFRLTNGSMYHSESFRSHQN